MVNPIKTRLVTAALLCLLILTLLALGAFTYLHGRQWLDSDHASEMILGELLAEEDTLLSENWLYSTELRLVYQTIFTMPLFKFLELNDDWALIRSINIILNCIVLILSYIFLASQLKISLNRILFSSLFLLMPISFDYWNFVLFGGYYIFFIIKLFFCIALYIKICFNTEENKKPYPVIILFSIMSFVLGIHGTRALLAVHIPLLIACIYIKAKFKQKDSFPFYLGIFSFLLCCAGYAVNGLLHLRYSFQSFDDMGIEHSANYAQKFGMSLANIAGFFGFTTDVGFTSLQGFFGITAIIAAFILIRSVFKICAKNKVVSRKYFLILFFAASAIFNIFVLVIVDRAIISRYFIPFMVLYIPIIAILFEHSIRAYNKTKRLAIIIGISVFLFGQSFLNFQRLAERDLNTVRSGYIEYLNENNLDFGFATFWNANVNTELSNGRIRMVSVIPTRQGPGVRQFIINNILTPRHVFDPGFYRTREGESFLLLSSIEWEMLRWSNPFVRVVPAYNDDNFVIIKYPSAEAIFEELIR